MLLLCIAVTGPGDMSDGLKELVGMEIGACAGSVVRGAKRRREKGEKKEILRG